MEKQQPKQKFFSRNGENLQKLFEQATKTYAQMPQVRNLEKR